MNCACKEWHRNGNRFRCYFGIKQGCRPAKIFANATAPFHIFFVILEIITAAKSNKKAVKSKMDFNIIQLTVVDTNY